MHAEISPKTVALRAPLFSPTAVVSRALPIPMPLAATCACPGWGDTQTAALASLQRVVDEGFVFGAVTGPKQAGKSAIVSKLLESAQRADRVCVHIRTPHQVSSKAATAIEEAVGKVVARFPSGGVKILIAVDDAHTASHDLLALLNYFAETRLSTANPQIVFAGERDLWKRLDSSYYEKLLRRVALRCSVGSLLHELQFTNRTCRPLVEEGARDK